MSITTPHKFTVSFYSFWVGDGLNRPVKFDRILNSTATDRMEVLREVQYQHSLANIPEGADSFAILENGHYEEVAGIPMESPKVVARGKLREDELTINAMLIDEDGRTMSVAIYPTEDMNMSPLERLQVKKVNAEMELDG